MINTESTFGNQSSGYEQNAYQPSQLLANEAPPLPSQAGEPPLPVNAPDVSQQSVQQDLQWLLPDGSTEPAMRSQPPPLPVAQTAARSDDISVPKPDIREIRITQGKRVAEESSPDGASDVASGIEPDKALPSTLSDAVATTTGSESKDLPTWTLKPGSLRQQLLSWGNTSVTWEVLWMGTSDFTVRVGHEFTGPLDEVVIQVVKAFSAQGAPISLLRARANHTLAVRSE
ncbi:TcpQ domain-containing protein [Vreelandella rituensis]|uniref:TcpQ domain-containing protein n=1 Tax=Vreelandella rituensis TaxID=2282306 RepID=UPI0015F0B17B|nr:TcpQ domain-containing protein [Halomonas rituensis]